jgi:hypothetical protein
VAYYFRNEDLNANNFFSNEAGRPRQEYRYDIGNYYIGGPIILPKIYRGKKNMFFSFGQEFQNQIVPYAVEESTVPTALERQGNFSASYNTNGSPITVEDPANGKQPFPGNIVPASRVNPIGTAILKMFPLPNFTDPNLATRYDWNYYIAASDPYNRRMDTLRLDYAPKQDWQIYGSIVNKSDHQEVPYTGSAGSTYFVLSPSLNIRPGRLITLHSTNTISPTLFNEASFGRSQITPTYTFEYPNLVKRTDLGIDIPQRNPSINPLNIIPKMTFGGIANASIVNYANNTPYYNQNTIYNFTDNVSSLLDSVLRRRRSRPVPNKPSRVPGGRPPVVRSVIFLQVKLNPFLAR